MCAVTRVHEAAGEVFHFAVRDHLRHSHIEDCFVGDLIERQLQVHECQVGVIRMKRNEAQRSMRHHLLEGNVRSVNSDCCVFKLVIVDDDEVTEACKATGRDKDGSDVDLCLRRDDSRQHCFTRHAASHCKSALKTGCSSSEERV